MSEENATLSMGSKGGIGFATFDSGFKKAKDHVDHLKQLRGSTTTPFDEYTGREDLKEKK